MIYEMTFQIRVSEITEGQKWYETLLQKKPDFVPHDGFAEWELVPGCWLQVAEGDLTKGNGPLRLGVMDLDNELIRLHHELYIENVEVFSRPEVSVKWCTFSDPWGNRIGLFEYLNEDEKLARIKTILGGRNKI